MNAFFLKIATMSISASFLVLAVLLLRLILKKAPKWISVLLWGFVALRLLMPFSIESDFSLIPDPLADGQIITNVGDVYIGETDTIGIYEGHEPQAGQQPVGSFVAQEDSLKPAKTVANTVYPILSWIWLAGVALMLLYTVISYILLRRKVSTAILLRKGIFQSENVASPFVLGIIRPKIYLPFRMDDQTLEYVIAHEQSHIRRKDHWWKPFGFILLAIHWFNPLMWLGYILLCRDIELACDEKVIKQMDNENRANYTEALVVCSVNHRRIAACPLAFGEVGVKERVKSVMNYKKPAFWIIMAAIVSCLVVALCFLTDPNTSINDQLSIFIDSQITDHFQTEESAGNACCANWEVLGTRKQGSETTVYMWVLYEEYSMNNGQLSEETGSHIPTVITVSYEDGQYKLIEYWEPRDGSYLVSDIQEKFPWYLQRKALDSQRYIKQQHAENEQMALEHFQSLPDSDRTDTSTDNVITDNDGTQHSGDAPGMLSLDDVIIVDNKTGEIIWNGTPKEQLPFDFINFIITNDRGEILNSEDRKITLENWFTIKNGRGEILDIDGGKHSFSLHNLIIVDNKTGHIVYAGNEGLEIVNLISTGLKIYYELIDGSWFANGHQYQYRLEITGRMPNAVADSTFVYLSNLETISFEQAWKAAGLSSNSADYFSPEEAVLVDWRTGDHGSNAVDDNNNFIIKTDKLHGSIAEAILSHHKREKPDGLLNTESHIILVNEVASGTPLVGQTNHVREVTVYVYYLNMRFHVQGDRPEEHDGIYGQAAITFTIDDNGIYNLKHFVKPESSVDSGAEYSAELKNKFVAASEDIAENEEKYSKQLLDSCWKNATEYMEHLKAQASAQPGGTITEMVCPLDYVSYEYVAQLYQSLTASIDSMTEAERFSALAEIFDNIAQGSPLEQHKFAQLTREIINNDKLVFEDAEVFDLAKDYATVFSKYATGDWGVQGLNVKSLSETAAQLDFSYWGEMWYSVKIVQVGEPWVTGEFTAPYQGELGKYLMTVQFHDAEPSEKLLEQYSMWTDHKLRISHGGTDHEMTMRIVPNADHGYNVYVGSDHPFWVKEQSSMMLNRLIGTVSVQLNFTTGKRSPLTVAGQSLVQGKYMAFFDTTPSYVLLPFTAIMQEFGAQIEWKTATVARIRFNGTDYTLNTQEVSLLADGSDLNCIIPTPGDRIHSQAIEHELLLNHITVKTVALMLGITIKIDVDYLNQTVVIDLAK